METPLQNHCGKESQENLHCKDYGNQQDKPPVLRFMAERIHTRQGSQAAAGQADQKKHDFRDPVLMLHGLFLICTHQHKSCEIDCRKITGKENGHFAAVL